MSTLMMLVLMSGLQAHSLFEHEWHGVRCADSSCAAVLDSSVVMRCVRVGDSVDVTMQQRSGTMTTRYAVDAATATHLRCHAGFTEGASEGHPMHVYTVLEVTMQADSVTAHYIIDVGEVVGDEVVETENALIMHSWYVFRNMKTYK